MDKSIVSEGKTTNEAIENGLKILNVSKNMVEIKVLESEQKRSFFSILSPRVVKVQLTLKDDKVAEGNVKKEKKEIKLSNNEQEKSKQNVEKFLKEFFEKVQIKADIDIEVTEKGLNINIKNDNLGFLIGYRGETLYAFQNILSSIASKGTENRVRVILDIADYKAKREKSLENLAENLAKSVIKTKKAIILEPMQAYERKIIHSKLQNNNLVETKSIGEEPRRKVVISLKKRK